MWVCTMSNIGISSKIGSRAQPQHRYKKVRKRMLDDDDIVILTEAESKAASRVIVEIEL